MATRRTTEFLDGQHARYVLVSHSPAYTAQEIAGSMHIPGRLLAKTVVVRVDGELALAVVPATKQVDTNALANAVEAEIVEIADEKEFTNRFTDCQLGTAPPFGNLFGMETYIDHTLAAQDDIIFNAGTHTDGIWMRFADYRRVARPVIAKIARPLEPSRTHYIQI
jgi:Ala-tRNA(Pro) deacylase